MTPAFEGIKEAVMQSSFGGMLAMFGGESSLDSLKEPFNEKLKTSLVKIVSSDSFENILKQNLHSGNFTHDILKKIDEFEGAPDYYTRKKIEVKSHHGVQRAFVYIREDSDLPTDQQALKEWTNNVDYKVGRLHSTLDAMIEG